MRFPGCRTACHGVGLIRQVVHVAGVKPLLHAQLQLDVGGLEDVTGLSGPVIIVANHASHLDTPVLLEALPSARRRRTAVIVADDYFVDSGCRGAAAAVAFNTIARQDRSPRQRFRVRSDRRRSPGGLLAAGWTVLMFPERNRSADGYVHPFGSEAAELAIEHGVPVLPVGIRGTYAAMPRGRAWPGRLATGPIGRSRRRVSVRFGTVLTAGTSDTAEDFTRRLADAVQGLITEDVGTWWRSQLALHRHVPQGAPEDRPEPPAGSWRRIWEQSQSPVAGGRPGRTRIWRRNG